MSLVDSSLTRRQGVVLAARVLCVFFLYWSLLNLSEIPSYVNNLIHSIAEFHVLHPAEGAFGGGRLSYVNNLYVSFVCGAVLRAAVELWVAGLFYRCGPKIAEFLLPQEDSPVDTSTTWNEPVM